jgi:hypothetical protein
VKYFIAYKFIMFSKYGINIIAGIDTFPGIEAIKL